MHMHMHMHMHVDTLALDRPSLTRSLCPCSRLRQQLRVRHGCEAVQDGGPLSGRGERIEFVSVKALIVKNNRFRILLNPKVM